MDEKRQGLTLGVLVVEFTIVSGIVCLEIGDWCCFLLCQRYFLVTLLLVSQASYYFLLEGKYSCETEYLSPFKLRASNSNFFL